MNLFRKLNKRLFKTNFIIIRDRNSRELRVTIYNQQGVEISTLK